MSEWVSESVSQWVNQITACRACFAAKNNSHSETLVLPYIIFIFKWLPFGTNVTETKLMSLFCQSTMENRASSIEQKYVDSFKALLSKSFINQTQRINDHLYSVLSSTYIYISKNLLIPQNIICTQNNYSDFSRNQMKREQYHKIAAFTNEKKKSKTYLY